MEIDKERINLIEKHVEKLSVVFLDASVTDIQELLSSEESQEKMRLFAEDDKSKLIFLSKEAVEHEEEIEGENEEVEYKLIMKIGLEYSDTTSGFVLIKNEPKKFKEQLFKGKPISTLLQCFQVGGQNPYTMIYSVLQNALEPYFQTFVKKKKEGSTQTRKRSAIPQIRKHFDGLRISLFQCQETFHIPEVDVEKCIHQEIREMVDSKVALSGHKFGKGTVDSMERKLRSLSNEIRKIVDTFDEDPEIPNTVSEINYWSGLDDALHSLKDRIETQYIKTTVDALKEHRRNKVALVFGDSKSKLYGVSQKASNYNRTFVRDLPVYEMQACKTLSDLIQITDKMFTVLGKLKNSDYPLMRAFQLVKAVSGDLIEQAIKILETYELLGLNFSQFDKTTNEVLEFFRTLKQSQTTLRSNLRSRFVKHQVIREKFESEEAVKFEERIMELRKFRRDHNELKKVIEKVFSPETFRLKDTNPLEKVNKSYQTMKNLGNKVLDISSEGEREYHVTFKKYKTMIAEVETFITTTIRDRLSSAKNAAESFRVFAQFNALFYKQGIRNSVNSFQNSLIEQVEKDIEALEEKFKRRYRNSQVFKMSEPMEMPQVAGAVIWAKQIERQLDVYIKRIDAVVGKGWERLQNIRVESCWVLNESLAEVFKIPLLRIQQAIRKVRIFKNVQHKKPEIIGTALVICYLKIVFPESEKEWTEMVEESRAMLETHEKDFGITIGNSISQADALLKDELSVAKRQQRDLIERCDKIKEKLRNNVVNLVDGWNKNTLEMLTSGQWKILKLGLSQDSVVIQGVVFEIVETKSKFLDLRVNFHKGIINLLNEYRVMSQSWLNLREMFSKLIMRTVINIYDIYPYYLSFRSSIATYKRVTSQINDEVLALAAGNMNEVHELLKRGFREDTTWKKTHTLHKYSTQMANVVNEFQRKTEVLNARYVVIKSSLKELENCNFNELGTNIQNIQKTVDQMNLEEKDYSNLGSWVGDLNTKVEDLLVTRLSFLVGEWKRIYKLIASKTLEEDGGEEIKVKSEYFRKNKIKKYRISIRLVNREMKALPSIQKTKVYWYNSLHKCFSAICSLPKIVSSRFDQSLDDSGEDTYSYLLGKLEHGIVREAYEMIDNKIIEVKKYIDQWFQYQALYNIDTLTISSQLGSRLDDWMELLNSIKKARKEAETTEAEQNFGTILVDFGDIQSKIHSRYDKTFKDMLLKFRGKLGKKGKEFFDVICKKRKVLEELDMDSKDGGVVFLEVQKEIKESISGWETLMNSILEGERIIEVNRIKFKQGWIFAQNIKSEWDAFLFILKKREDTMRLIKPRLIKKVQDEFMSVRQLINDLKEDWSKGKPISQQEPYAAISTLKRFEVLIRNINEKNEKIQIANEILSLDMTLDKRADIVEEELTNLKNVWTNLQVFYDGVNRIRDTQLKAVKPSDVKRKLDDFLEEIKKTSSYMQTYQPVREFKETVLQYRKTIPKLSELRTEAMETKHWLELQKRLGVTWNVSELTVGDLWKTDMESNAVIFDEVIQVAKGELVLRVFLQETRSKWSSWSFQTVLFNNRCYLIKGWDEFFEEVNDSLKSLSSTRASPYFKTFKDEFISWENRLSSISFIGDIWMDVQRVWVYLEGVFIGNQDIKQQLPKETKRFKTVDKEFVALMKRVQKNPGMMEVIEIPNLQRQLERLHQMLLKIQKSLGEYLEKQRQAFPRFYFVGDEDLLEIIGHSGDPFKVQRHLKKMFAGINQLLITEKEGKVFEVSGMCSKEAESIQFTKIVLINEGRKIYEWLTDVEKEMRVTLASVLIDAVGELAPMFKKGDFDNDDFHKWLVKYPCQLVIVTSQILWTKTTEDAIENGTLQVAWDNIKNMLSALAGSVLKTSHPLTRTKIEQLITELVHQRDVLKKLVQDKITEKNDFAWLYCMRLYLQKGKEWDETVKIQVANADFYYRFEYLGITDKLVQTPLTDRCYLALTQALFSRQGGSPFGPAGTGKTETVKMLGAQLGVYCIVFCCDENFDFKAMGRIFVGLCECGAWGCFDEFNRLNEKILSAVSQQIMTIQRALREDMDRIELIDRKIRVNKTTGLFITMNPGYAGRSQLPQNLKQLFRSIAMVKPDKEIIAEVIMFSQGFVNSEELARKVVLFFTLCFDELSQQSHYDFGLRALKGVLVNAGQLKRKEMDHSMKAEQKILIQSVLETVTPKLVGSDKLILRNLLMNLFPGVALESRSLDDLKEKIEEVAKRRNLIADESWAEKIIQLFQIQNLSHGIILVGPAGIGKSTCWQVLNESLELIDRDNGIEKKGMYYIIDPKALTKEELYGNLDPTTREWTDGVFTHILRKIVDNLRGESEQRHWIVFDGDVDPEWVENLNSVLDCNKLFTLPNGERLSIPPNVRILFEVRNLDYATLATVSRCGMVWYGREVLNIQMYLKNYLEILRHTSVCSEMYENKEVIDCQTQVASVLEKYFQSNAIVEKCVLYAEKRTHIMKYTHPKAIGSMISLMNKGIMDLMEHKNEHVGDDLDSEVFENFCAKRLIFACYWGMGSSMLRKDRIEYSNWLRSESPVPVPEESYLDYVPHLESGEWETWGERVPEIDVAPESIITGAVIPTSDTAKHSELLLSWIKDKRCVILCGPPGSGKTMILTAVLKELMNFIAAPLNFSSATSKDLILRTFEQHCKILPSSDGLVLKPTQEDKNIVIFCDEINLPCNDDYGTQRVITFIRQLVEQNGYWRASDKAFIRVERIFFVGACNPPTDPGRVVMTPRFLRHSGILYVDFPGRESTFQIYKTFTKALFKLEQVKSTMGDLVDETTKAMVDFYIQSQNQFTTELQPHYIYSPRELTRWMRALLEGIEKGPATMERDYFIRLLAHEGLRIFADRLVERSEKEWTYDILDKIIMESFGDVDPDILERPILFTFLYDKTSYMSLDRETLGDFIQERMNSFTEEQVDIRLVLFDDVLEHVVRIDRVLRQPLGHLLLAGVSGAGKTILPKFVAWMSGYDVFQIKAHSKYTLENFEEDLRKILKRAGVECAKVCFIFDESNVLEPAFLEYMNALLASGEVPGLFEDDEYQGLINLCKTNIEGSYENDDELYRWFTKNVQLNLHIVFTINPVGTDFKNRQTTSPALFNRCVVDWFGDWSDDALRAVGHAFMSDVDLTKMPLPGSLEGTELKPEEIEEKKHENIVETFVSLHNCVRVFCENLTKVGKRNFVTPRDFLDLIQHFKKNHEIKFQQLQEQQQHIDSGLENLKSTEEDVARMQEQLREKDKQLVAKNTLAQQKLRVMVRDQQIAEKKKQEAEAMAEKLDEQEREMKRRKQRAEQDLSKVIPMLQEARQAVAGVKKRHLDEMRMLPNPPKIIKRVLDNVVRLIDSKFGKSEIPWTTIKTRLKKATFVKEVVAFDSKKLTEKQLKSVRHLVRGLSIDAAGRASQACGPLAKWLVSQVSYAGMLLKVEPLQAEVRKIKVVYDRLMKKQTEIEKEIDELQGRLKILEEDYALLIAETQVIKAEKENVDKKVKRSVKLLASLSEESQRWKVQSFDFNKQLDAVVGDVILSSSFLTYIGNFDEFMRRVIFKDWIKLLDINEIQMTKNFSVIGYLTNTKERLKWQEADLPVDDLYVENSVMLHRYNRYPLIIDPTGNAVEFLMRIFKSKKICKTSFLDPGFLKNLETSLRFGTPLLVEDAERIDPILNPVLNKEIVRHGGRNLVRLASQDVDFSDQFQVFMSTRDPTYAFSVDLLSRVTKVNFTVTPASLQSQCLNIILKSERPEVEKQRTEQMKLQGEYALKLRNLEDELLNSIRAAKNILEDEKVLNTLEVLKKNSLEINQKVEQAKENMLKISQIRNSYIPLASYCSKVFFTLEQMKDVHFLYHFSLEYFLAILHDTLQKKGLEINDLINRLFTLIYSKTAKSLLHQDRMMLALKLAEIKIKGTIDNVPKEEFDLFLKSGKLFPRLIKLDKSIGFSQSQVQLLTELSHISAFENVEHNINSNASVWKNFLSSEKNIDKVPRCWMPSSSLVVEDFRQMIVMKSLRPEHFKPFASKFISRVFGDKFLSTAEVNLENIVNEIKCFTPLLLISLPGFDASQEVQELTWKAKKAVKSIAMGSSEGFDQANKEFPRAMKNGSWLLLKNVHLSPSFLMKIEKTLYEKKLDRSIHEDFRIFLTAEVHKSIPVNVLRTAYKLVYEPAPGVTMSLNQSFSALEKTVVDREPIERSKLYLLASWFHAVVQERLRFSPLGWSKYYEFTTGDLKWSLDAIDKWVDIAAKGSSNIPPKNLPWKALHTLIGESIYGGKLDNEFDTEILQAFIRRFFSPECYEKTFEFVNDGETRLVTPAGFSYAELMKWVESIPGDKEKPGWYGLPTNVQKMTRTKEAMEIIRNLVKLEDTRGATQMEGKKLEEEEIEGETEDDVLATTLMIWKPIKDTIASWKSILPKELQEFKLNSVSDRENHLFRSYKREITAGAKLLERIHRDCDDLMNVCNGKERPNQIHWHLNDCIKKQLVPKEWRTFSYLETVTLNEWVSDFSKRVEQLSEVLERLLKGDYSQDGISLGLLLFPEGWLSATRQEVSHNKKVALEKLALSVQIGVEERKDDSSFVIRDLYISCAKWNERRKGLEVDQRLYNSCPTAMFSWVEEGTEEFKKTMADPRAKRVPLYLNRDRKHLLGGMPVPCDIDRDEVYLRGISFLTWHKL